MTTEDFKNKISDLQRYQCGLLHGDPEMLHTSYEGYFLASDIMELLKELEIEENKPSAPSGWVSVADRLPEDGQRGLAVVAKWSHPEGNETDICVDLHSYHHPDRWIAYGQSVHTRGVTHWIPLPTKPE